MIKNIKIHNIFDIIEISKYMEPNKCTRIKIYENIYLNVSYDFPKFDGSKKSRCDDFSGTTQGNSYLTCKSWDLKVIGGLEQA